MPSRRRFIDGLASAGALALAGCLDAGGDGAATPDGTDAWLYDAGERFGVSTVAAGTIDVGAVRDAPLSGQFAGEFERVDDDFESVDLDAVDAVAATGFVDVDEELSGGSVVALGSFDPDAVGEELTADGLERAGTERDADRYESDRGNAVAVREDALVVGGVDGRPDPAIDPVAAALDAGAGDARGFAERENGATLLGELSGDVSAGVDLGEGLRREVASNLEEAPGPAATVLEATDAFGLDATFRGETAEVTYVLVADPSALDLETVREFADAVEDLEGSTIDDVAVSRDGRAVVATAEVETDGIVESHLEVLRRGHREEGQPPERSFPQVAFEAERTDDDRARLTHRGGDSFRRVEVQYAGVEAARRETWTGDPVSAGDTYVTDRPVAADGTVRVVWESEEGDRAATLFRATV